MSSVPDVASLWSLRGQMILVTGAAGGIGRVVVETLLAAGASVAACDRAGVEVTELQQLADNNGRFTYAACDATNPEEVTDWVRTTERSHPIDGVVNVAGAWQIRPFAEVSLNELDSLYAANLRSAFVVCQAAAPYLIARGKGSIVNFASTAGEYGSISPAAHYAAAKAGVIGMTKSLARELSPLGVRVNAISPGPIDTAALAGGTGPVDHSAVAARTLLGRLGRPIDIAASALYLLSDASAFVTGHVLRVNGGSLL